MRRRFGKIISQLAEKDEELYVLVGDIGYRVFDEFRDKFPNRFINMGICEQSIISVASGMALEGLKPWVYTITPFLIERPFEQVKLDIDQQNVNVNLVGFADYPTLGPTHTEINAKKMMKLFHNIESFFPSDGDETEKMILQAYEREGPSFISLKSDPTLSKSITGGKK
jgi:transketolase